ncbi:MAG TPA: DUF29 domain-containing protein [Trinickia sp.]|jgi:hypothetical protein|nr:DUF29 domain-containing protein [Trinickia sp.]
MGMSYETDVVAWANEQAALLRAGKFSALDIEHIADEIEDVGKSEQRELTSRMAVLLALLLRWQCQPEGRGANWQTALRVQREAIDRRLNWTPSLRSMLHDNDWIYDIWSDAVVKAIEETDLSVFPEACPWSMQQALDPEFLPD